MPCSCHNTCYGYQPCSCNNTCYGGYHPCSCNNTCYEYGPEAKCNHTFQDCINKGNWRRFGGFPGIHGGIWRK